MVDVDGLRVQTKHTNIANNTGTKKPTWAFLDGPTPYGKMPYVRANDGSYKRRKAYAVCAIATSLLLVSGPYAVAPNPQKDFFNKKVHK